MTEKHEGLLAEGLRALVGTEEVEERTTDDIARERVAAREAATGARERDDNEALTLVGAIVGDFCVRDRIFTGKRWRYVAQNVNTGRDHYLRGYELVRQVRATIRNGGVVVMPNEPWRSS